MSSPEHTQPAIRYLQYEQLEEAWDIVLKPWLSACQQEAWRQVRPVAMVAPNASTVAYVKERLLAAGLSALGVHFLTPGSLRSTLLATWEQQPVLAIREELHLIARIAATELARISHQPSTTSSNTGTGKALAGSANLQGVYPTTSAKLHQSLASTQSSSSHHEVGEICGLPDPVIAQSVLAEPDAFVKACDALEGGGWRSDGFEHKEVRAMAAAYFGLLDKVGLKTAFRIDQSLKDSVSRASECFSELLIFGFTAQHWSQFNLLSAAPYYATNTLMCLPAQAVTQAEVMWQSQWEQEVGSAEPLRVEGRSQKQRTAQNMSVSADTSNQERVLDFSFKRIAEMAERYACIEEKRDGADYPSIRYWMAKDLNQEADVITEQVIHYLSDSTCERIAVVFSNRVSPLAREVGERLCRLDIPHHNIPGHYPGQPTEQWLFEHWVEFQSAQRLQPYIQFIKTLHWRGLLPIEVYYALEKALMDAFRECMTDDLKVLLAYVAETKSMNERLLSQIDAWPLLPDSTTFELFFEAVMQPLERIGWPARMDSLLNRATPLGAVLQEPIQCEAFLAWLRAVVNVPGRTRPALGREPFARVQLTTLEEAAGQAWSHIIFAGVNQGAWPPEEPGSAFLSETGMAKLNRSVTVEGAQGQGHEVMRVGYSYLLSPKEKRRRYEQDFFALIGSARRGVSLTASALAADGSGKEVAPSDLWMRLYYAEHGALYSVLHNEAYIEQSELFLHKGVTGSVASSVHFPEVRHAFEQRRDREASFGEYSFCYKTPPKSGLQLSCKAWEAAYKRPASAWYEHVLKVRQSASPASQEIRSLTVGTWLHDWVNPTPWEKQFGPLPDVDTWTQQIDRVAGKKHAEVKRAYQQAERSLPDWWQVDWAWTRRLAWQFSREIAAQQPWSHGLGEFTLRPGDVVTVPGIMQMPVRGRIDLVLGQHGALLKEDTDLHRTAWIIDFKTGADAPLSARGLAAGDGIQLALYALALNGAGIDTVDVSILRPYDALKPQLSLEAVLEQTELWASLWLMHKRGCLGDRGAVRSEFTFTGNYPLATLPVDPSILEEKWQLTQASLRGTLNIEH